MDQDGPKNIFSVTAAVAGERVTVVVTGEVDMSTAGQMIQTATDAQTRAVTLDLHGVTFFDSAAIQAVIRLVERYDGGTLEVVPSAAVLRVLQISGLDAQPWLKRG
ncbi:STAS domain-containing protein [Actinoplanes sp. TFC3]|uniref:STAS domain-containing protein n=1 Tax=Actinoplanes sp. TFC3 TaxID=1710355 RepID=UPI000ACA3199|nr:STAS domain-containing protein [Actinoplanes sp. TFC3]